MCTRFFNPHKADWGSYGVTMLLCRSDVLTAIYSLQSLFYHLGYALPVYIISDGSLKTSDIRTLTRLFNAHIVLRENILHAMRRKYPKERLLLRYLHDPGAHIKRLKLAALLLSPFRKTIFLESDVLFTNTPREIKSFLRSSGNFYGSIHPDTYTLLEKKKQHMDFLLRRVLYYRAGTKSDYLFNGSVLLVQKSLITGRTLRILSSALELAYAVDYHKTYYFEDALLSVIFTSRNSRSLPPARFATILMEIDRRRIKKRKHTPASIHVTTPMRSYLYHQSLSELFTTRFFR